MPTAPRREPPTSPSIVTIVTDSITVRAIRTPRRRSTPPTGIPGPAYPYCGIGGMGGSGAPMGCGCGRW
ncbi:hypothetical protein GCM10020000_31380 [Streptomyces olivoverticillatus]